MPTRSLSSSVLKWPERETVDAAVRRWVREASRERPDLLGAAYLGSYARGDWGPGSDVDLLLILREGEGTEEARSSDFDVTELPVPADIIVLTREEWEWMRREDRRFVRVAQEEGVWVLPLEPPHEEGG